MAARKPQAPPRTARIADALASVRSEERDPIRRSLETMKAIVVELARLRVTAPRLGLVVAYRPMGATQSGPIYPRGVPPVDALTPEHGSQVWGPEGPRVDYAWFCAPTPGASVPNGAVDVLPRKLQPSGAKGTLATRRLGRTVRGGVGEDPHDARAMGIGSPLDRALDALQRGHFTYQHPAMSLIGRLGGLLGELLGTECARLDGDDAGSWSVAVHQRLLPDASWRLAGQRWVPTQPELANASACAARYADAVAASIQLVDRIDEALTRRILQGRSVVLELCADGKSVVLQGQRCEVSAAHFEVLKRLAAAHDLGPDRAAVRPQDPVERRKFRARLSDMRSRRGKVSGDFRAALNALPCCLFHDSEPRFNPALDLIVTKAIPGGR